MSRPVLQHLQIGDLIAFAGDDPWAVDDSLQAGSPTQINFLAQAFHQAAGSATAAEQTFQTAQQHFQQYNRENGEQPINNGAEVQRVKDGLHATNQQLGQIAADLEIIAAALAEARTTSGNEIETLNANLQEYDRHLADYLTNYDTYKRYGYDIDAYIEQCHSCARTDTQTVVNNVTLIRKAYSRSLERALTNLRVKDGYDPDIAVRKLDADDTPYGADGGKGSPKGIRGASPGRLGNSRAANTASAPVGVDEGNGGIGNPRNGSVAGQGPGLDGGSAALPPWIMPSTPTGPQQPGKSSSRTEAPRMFTQWGNLGDGIDRASREANQLRVLGGLPASRGLGYSSLYGKGMGLTGQFISGANGLLEIQTELKDGASLNTALLDVVPETAGDIAGGIVGAGAGAEAGAGFGAAFGSLILPGPGTAVGAVVGAGVGAFVGGWSGSEIGKTVGHAFTDVSRGAWHGLFD